MGGLARKATIIDDLKDEGVKPIILDSGNLFYKNPQIDPGVTETIAKINAQVIAEAYGEIGCDAFSPGANDFAFGLKDLMKLYNKSEFDYVSCNIFHESNPKNLLFKPYKILKRNKHRVGVIGLSSVFLSDGIIVADPVSALDEVINEVESKSDVIVLLFNAIDQDLNRIYDRGYNIDLIVKSGKGATRSRDGGAKIPTYIAGNRGKVLYDFTLSIKNIKKKFVDIAWCENTVKRVNDRLEKMKKGDVNVDLEKLYANDSAALRRVLNYKKQIENADNKLSNAVNTIVFDKIELSKDVFDKPSILKIVDKGKIKIKDLVGTEIPDHKGRLPGDPHYNHGH